MKKKIVMFSKKTWGISMNFQEKRFMINHNNVWLYDNNKSYKKSGLQHPSIKYSFKNSTEWGQIDFLHSAVFSGLKGVLICTFSFVAIILDSN